MSSEFRILSVTFTVSDTDAQQARGVSVWEQMTQDEIAADLAATLDEATKRWYAAVGHKYLECKPEGFG